jgi:hypothetical protein
MAKGQPKIVTTNGEFKLGQRIWYMRLIGRRDIVEEVVDCDLCIGAGWLTNMLKDKVKCVKCHGRGTINSADLANQLVRVEPTNATITTITMKCDGISFLVDGGVHLGLKDIFRTKAKCTAAAKNVKVDA